MNNMNTISLGKDIWNIISYNLHVSELQSLAICCKELSCLMSSHEGLQLYNSINVCKKKITNLGLKLENMSDQNDIKETVETAIKILEYHNLHPKMIPYKNIVSLNSWIYLSAKQIDDVTYKNFLNLDGAIWYRNFQSS